MADIPPNETIWIKNLETKAKKREMKRALYALLSPYGRILDIVVCRTQKLRGQAWVVFNEVPAATNALRHMREFPLYDRPMVIQYAKGKSEAIIRLTDDSYTPRDKRRKLEEKEKKKAEALANGAAAARTYGAMPAATGVSGSQESLPNSILFVENLHVETTGQMLHCLFSRFAGLKEVRMVEARPGIAFVEYIDEAHAAVAMDSLQSFKITADHPMAISYAKR